MQPWEVDQVADETCECVKAIGFGRQMTHYKNSNGNTGSPEPVSRELDQNGCGTLLDRYKSLQANMSEQDK